MGGRAAGEGQEPGLDLSQDKGVQDGQIESGSLCDLAQDRQGHLPSEGGAGVHGVQRVGARTLLHGRGWREFHQTQLHGGSPEGTSGERDT